MNKFTQLLNVIFLILCSQLVVGQQNYDVLFETTTIKDGDKYLDGTPSSQILKPYIYDGQYYLILQFKDIPTPRFRKQLTDKGIELSGYLPNYAYWASIPASANLDDLSSRAIILPKPTYKLSLQLYNKAILPDHATDILKINGFVGKPEFAKKTRGEQLLFVNNRYIKSNYLHHAIADENLLQKFFCRYPFWLFQPHE